MVPLTITLIVATVWLAAWSESLQAEVNQGYWPPLNSSPATSQVHVIVTANR